MTILCVTPNPAVDRTLVTPGFQPNDVNRASEALVAAGGKGMNVARALKILGSEPICMGLLGGHTGRLVAALAQQEGLRAEWTWFDGETRTCVIITDTRGNDTVVNEPGGVPAAAWKPLAADLAAQAAHASVAMLSGSLPRGVPREGYRDLITAVKAQGAAVWVDASSDALRHAYEAAPTGVKVNAAEASALLGGAITDVDSAVQAAQQLHQRNGATVVITLGQDGAVLADAGGRWAASTSPIAAVSSTGSGDSFFAGLIHAYQQGKPPSEALRKAVAVGAANALQAGGSRFSPSSVAEMMERTRVSQVR